MGTVIRHLLSGKLYRFVVSIPTVGQGMLHLVEDEEGYLQGHFSLEQFGVATGDEAAAFAAAVAPPPAPEPVAPPAPPAPAPQSVPVLPAGLNPPAPEGPQEGAQALPSTLPPLGA